jgi:hypothetical protein
MDYIGNNTNSIEWAQGRNEGYIPDGSLRLITDNDDIKFSKETNIDSEYKVGTIVLANSEGDKHFLYPWDMNGDLLDVDNMLYTEDTHFYGVIKKPLYADVNGKIPEKMHKELRSISNAFYLYWQLKRYADSVGVSVFNASEYSLIDAFPRKKPEE